MTLANLAAAVVANALWQDAVVALVAAVLLHALRRRAAGERYRVAIALTITAVVLPIGAAIAPSGTLPRTAAPTLVTRLSGSSPIDARGGAAAATAVTAGSPYLTYLAWAYVTAVTIRLAILALAALGASRIRHRAPRLSPAAARALLDASGTPSIRGRTVSVHFSREAGVPHVWGFRSPAIVLPERLREAPADVLAAVVGHEAAHISRRDMHVAVGLEVLTALIPLHPCLWWLKRQAGRYRELACDRLALATTGLDPASYARALVEVAGGGRGPAAWPAPAFGHLALLEERVRVILARPSEPPIDRRVGLSSAALAVISVVPLGAVSARTEPPASIAGRWTLDRAATRVPSRLALLELDLKITESERGLRIHQLRRNYSGRPEIIDFQLPTDGTPVVVPLPGAHSARVDARWSAGRLIVNSAILDTGERDRDELSSDGRRLTIDGTLETTAGVMPHIYVLVRAGAPDLKVGPTR